MPHGLHENERAVQDQRRDPGESKLGRRVKRPWRGRRVRRQHQRQRRQRREHGERVAGAFDLEHQHMMAQRACEQAQADDAVADDHHGRVDRVAGEGARGRAAGHHHRADQGELDHGDCQREHERAERLADAMRDDFRVMHAGEHGRDQRGRDERDQHPAERPRPDRGEHDARREWKKVSGGEELAHHRACCIGLREVSTAIGYEKIVSSPSMRLPVPSISARIDARTLSSVARAASVG